LSDVNLGFPSSGIVSIVGPNGSGKSTLLKCMNMILKPKGNIRFDNKNIHSLSISSVAKIFGYVPQGSPSSFPVTVFDMILLGRRPYLGWNPSKEDIRVVSENISRLGLEHLGLRRIDELSGGERQKVLMARALAQEPRILLLDEPTSNLDIKHQIDVMTLIRRIVREKNLLAIIAIHDLNIASQYSDRIVMLSKGKVFAQGKPQTILTRENIMSIYHVNVAIHKHGNVQHIVPVEGEDFISLEKPSPTGLA